MDPPTHIIDPDGEVIIILRNSNSPFAEPGEDMLVNGFPRTDDIQLSAKEIKRNKKKRKQTAREDVAFRRMLLILHLSPSFSPESLSLKILSLKRVLLKGLPKSTSRKSPASASKSPQNI